MTLLTLTHSRNDLKLFCLIVHTDLLLLLWTVRKVPPYRSLVFIFVKQLITNDKQISCSTQLSRFKFQPACHVQDCDFRPPVLVWQCPGSPGRRLSARHWRPCQTTAFCQHSNTRCQLDTFWRRDLCRRRTTSLEQSAAQSQTMWLSYGQFRRLLKTFLFRLWGSVNCF